MLQNLVKFFRLILGKMINLTYTGCLYLVHSSYSIMQAYRFIVLSRSSHYRDLPLHLFFNCTHDSTSLKSMYMLFMRKSFRILRKQGLMRRSTVGGVLTLKWYFLISTRPPDGVASRPGRYLIVHRKLLETSSQAESTKLIEVLSVSSFHFVTYRW